MSGELTAEAGKVVELRDDNFDSLTRSGAWFVDIYAPWCSHCQRLEPTWRQLADELKPLGVSVAKVDGTKNKVLLMRFGVEAYPSIYLLREGKSWQYDGARSFQSLKEFALTGFKSAQPMPFHKSPVSAFGRVMGALHSFPALAKRAYTHLREDKGFSDMTIISGLLLVPLALGGLGICILDVMYTRQPHLAHQHYE
ncbi:thioredoxin-related transmembrane protein 1 [Monoraphidium neglectum]|uniref:Thioredoxin-related transmembrane protein 1 n=1 Tax=Monoraphidium neglectum TaxID=145388 RepID=A0A0D2NNR4_9CHLO|nr:thioredoxin-related transmembrane protein 1 [Monoraphidium neglectum]KIZ06106.1 thioredoxin-related transmembrane protein 1 [Monoraphidium neglectum]|eukprot:XP_013905125.1 thioredoxin-related transmembrane protein 1 [Monoraphidium neglectum]